MNNPELPLSPSSPALPWPCGRRWRLVWGSMLFIGLLEILELPRALLSPCWAPLPFPILLPTCLLLTLGEAARRRHETDQVCLSLGLDRCGRCVQTEAAADRVPTPCRCGSSPARAAEACVRGFCSPMRVLSVSGSWASLFAGPLSTVQEGRHGQGWSVPASSPARYPGQVALWGLPGPGALLAQHRPQSVPGEGHTCVSTQAASLAPVPGWNNTFEVLSLGRGAGKVSGRGGLKVLRPSYTQDLT